MLNATSCFGNKSAGLFPRFTVCALENATPDTEPAIQEVFAWSVTAMSGALWGFNCDKRCAAAKAC